MMTSQLSPNPRILFNTSLTCPAPSGPSVLEIFSINPLPIVPRPIKKPNNWASRKTMGGKANVVKKAVAPAIRNGLFLFSNASEGRRLLARIDNSFCFWIPGMSPVKVEDSFSCCRVYSSATSTQSEDQSFN